MLLGQTERVVGAVGAHLQRVERKTQVVDRRGRRGEVVDEVDRLIDEVGLDDVQVQVDEIRRADVLDVGQRAGLEVVYADDTVAPPEKLVAQMRAQKPGAAGHEAGWHVRGA